MSDDIFIYVIDMPYKAHEVVCPCLDGYCIYINARLSQFQQEEAFRHAMRHINNHDFESENDVGTIEYEAHRES